MIHPILPAQYQVSCTWPLSFAIISAGYHWMPVYRQLICKQADDQAEREWMENFFECRII
jgi:hypothetical protein